MALIESKYKIAAISQDFTYTELTILADKDDNIIFDNDKLKICYGHYCGNGKYLDYPVKENEEYYTKCSRISCVKLRYDENGNGYFLKGGRREYLDTYIRVANNLWYGSSDIKTVFLEYKKEV